MFLLDKRESCRRCERVSFYYKNLASCQSIIIDSFSMSYTLGCVDSLVPLSENLVGIEKESNQSSAVVSDVRPSDENLRDQSFFRSNTKKE